MGGGLKDFDDEPETHNPSHDRWEKLEEAEKQARDAEEKERQANERAEEARRREEDANRKVQEAQKLAKEERQRAEEQARQAAKERRRVEQERQQAEQERARMKQIIHDLSQGIEPEFIPTPEERAAAEARISFREDKLHFAIAGAAGSGKSSLINAFRRMSDNDVQAAKTGTSETTFEIGRYPDPDPDLPKSRFVWYDIPGAGTQTIDDWQYFKSQGLFVFDLVILITDNRFLKSDAILLQHCQRLDVPTFIVRSKADQQINNIQIQMQVSDDENSDRESKTDHWKNSYPTARDTFIEDSRKSIRKGLATAGLPEQEVYIVSRAGVHLVTSYMGTNQFPTRGKKYSIYKRLIDEKKLVRHVLTKAHERRYPQMHTANSSGR